MSQTSGAAAPPPPARQAAPAYAPPAPATVATRPEVPVATQPAVNAAVDTPTRLRRLSLGVVVAGIVVAVVGALSLGLLAQTVDRARANTDQLIRVQQIESNLLAADANATNAFLVGGLEAPARRTAYDDALAQTGSLIAEAAKAQPADADALAALNQQVLAYAAGIESARANNRQGYPIGSQYLRNASNGLRADALPITEALVAANTERAAGSMNVGWGWPLVVVTVLALVWMLRGQLWLSRHFRRRINPGMLVGSIVLLVLLIASASALAALGQTVRSVRVGSFADVNAAAAARIEANNAKSAESLTLIARGSGGTYETAWKASAAEVTTNLDRLRDSSYLGTAWTAYTDTHVQVRKLDDDGSWDDAVALATGSDASSSNGTFATFDTQLGQRLDAAAGSTSDTLDRWLPGVVVGAFLALLGGLASAWLGRRGIATRLKEYR